MRIDDAGARTWLLAAIAGWAVVAWGLALVGMGARVQPLDEDPGLLRPLPQMPDEAAARLGPPGQYSEIGARPLFAPDRAPRPFVLQGDADDAGSDEFDYMLTSTLITPELRMAILQPSEGGDSVRVKLDEAPESHPAWRLIAVGPRSAVFEGPEGQRELDLRVFDGTGGQPPTRQAATDDRDLPIDPPRRRPSPADAGDAGEEANGARPAAPADPPDRTGSGRETGSDSGRAEPRRPESREPTTDQSQMEAIRQRIQARREQMRRDNQSRQPPTQSP